MERNIIYSFLSALCLLISTNGLLTKLLSVRKNLFLMIYLTIMCFFTRVFHIGHISGLVVLGVLFVLISILVEEHKLFNLFFACFGYLISVTCNNILLAILERGFHIPTTVLIEEYWYIFPGVYAIILAFVMYFLRKILYQKLRILEMFLNLSKVTQCCLIANILMYCVIFIVTISLGENVGYPKSALLFNSMLFGTCLLVSSMAIFSSAKSVKNEEKQKAEAKQSALLEEYVESLENLLREMRSFRHDYKNILASMAGYIREGKLEELRIYYDQVMECTSENKEMQVEAWEYLKNIEPMELKGFLYEKMLMGLARDVPIRVYIPEHVKVLCKSMDDLIRILGVFIDNAIEEVELLKERRMMIKITCTDKGVLFEIRNNYGEAPNITKMGEEHYSTKGKGRGIGLYGAERLMQKHPDMFHELKIEHGEVIQRLEIFTI